MPDIIAAIEAKSRKVAVVPVRSGDQVRVHQKIKEGDKERIQVFAGTVIRVDRKNSLTARLTVRKVTSGVGVEKSFLLHSPNVVKIEVVRRSKVRRNYLSYMRELTGKSARLTGQDFDRESVNAANDAKAEPGESVEPAAITEESETPAGAEPKTEPAK